MVTRVGLAISAFQARVRSACSIRFVPKLILFYNMIDTVQPIDIYDFVNNQIEGIFR